MSSRPELSLQCYFWLGLCGSPRITDVGGVPYLVPVVQKHKVTFFFSRHHILYTNMYGDILTKVLFWSAAHPRNTT